MAIKGISLVEDYEYISTHDEDETEQDGATVWILGSLDAGVRARVGDNSMTMEQTEAGTTRMHMHAATRNLEAVRYGLRGWRNFKDENGNEHKFETVTAILNGKAVQVVSPATLNLIPQYIINELGIKLVKENSLSEEEEKNSDMQLSLLNSSQSETAEDADQSNKESEAVT